MPVVSVRQAVLSDLEVLTPLFDGYRQFYGRSPDLPAAECFLRARFNHGESVVFLAHTETGPVGFTQLYPAFCSVLAAKTFVLYDLFVTPAARGTGAGRALMEAAEAHGRNAGAARLELSTANTNVIGQSLYESCGWVRDNVFYVYQKSLRD